MRKIFNPPLISVVIPCYNVERYIAECLNSVLGQSYENLEVIVINDGSTDGTARVIHSFLQDKRVKYIEQDNQGVSKARNVGLDIANGEYISFVDADDIVCSDYIGVMYDYAKKYNSDIIICDTRLVDEKEEVDLLFEEMDKEEIMQRLNEDWRYIVVWNKLYKRELFTGLRFPESRIYEDEYLLPYVLWRASKVIQINEKLYYHRKVEGSIMNSEYTEEKLKEAIFVFDDRAKFYKQHNLLGSDRFQKIKWQESIYKKGYLRNNLDYAKDYILAHPYDFYKYSGGGKKDKIKLYLQLLKEKIKK